MVVWSSSRLVRDMPSLKGSTRLPVVNQRARLRGRGASVLQRKAGSDTTMIFSPRAKKHARIEHPDKCPPSSKVDWDSELEKPKLSMDLEQCLATREWVELELRLTARSQHSHTLPTGSSLRGLNSESLGFRPLRSAYFANDDVRGDAT